MLVWLFFQKESLAQTFCRLFCSFQRHLHIYDRFKTKIIIVIDNGLIFQINSNPLIKFITKSIYYVYQNSESTSEDERKKRLAREREMERALLQGKSIHEAVRDADVDRVKDLLHNFPEMRE